MTDTQGQQQTQHNNSSGQATQQTAADRLREKVKQVNQQTATNLQFRGGRCR